METGDRALGEHNSRHRQTTQSTHSLPKLVGRSVRLQVRRCIMFPLRCGPLKLKAKLMPVTQQLCEAEEVVLSQCMHQEAAVKLSHAKVSSQHLAVSRLCLPLCNAACCIMLLMVRYHSTVNDG